MIKKKTMKNTKHLNKFEEGGYWKKVSENAGINSISAGLGNSLNGGYATENNIGSYLQGAGTLASLIPGPWGAIAGTALNVIGGLAERALGTKWDNAGVAEAENNLNLVKNFNSKASDYDSLLSDINSLNKLNKTVEASDLGEDGWFAKLGWKNSETQKKANEFNKNTTESYNTAIRNVNTVANNIASDTLANLERNYAAFGGLLPKGLFAYGGQTHGADFTNGLMFINNGGTHESNPYEGVPISMDQEGNPNLVEEGEVIWNDYVFSNRLKVPKAVRNKYKLRGPKDMTFADAIEKLSKESEERPNDPISQRGLNHVLPSFMMEQETIKAKKSQVNNKGNKFAYGGPQILDYSFLEGIPGYWNQYNFTPFATGYEGLLPSYVVQDSGIIPYVASPAAKGNNYGSNYDPEIEAAWFREKGIEKEEYESYIRSLSEDELKKITQDAGKKYTNKERAIYYLTDGEPGDRYEAAYNHMMKAQKLKEAQEEGDDTEREEVEEKQEDITRTNRYWKRKKDSEGNITLEQMEIAPWEGIYDKQDDTGFYGKYFSEAFPQLKALSNGAGTNRDVEGENGTEYYTDYYYDDLSGQQVTPQINNKRTWMRYAPVAGYGLMTLADAFKLTNKADYTNADAIIKAAGKASQYDPVSFTPIGDYLTYNPFDTEHTSNQLRSISGATRRNIMNTSGGNRATAMAGILASDNNTMNQMGDLYRKAVESNLAQKQQVADFNRATNMYNSEGRFKAAAANQAAAMQARQLGLDGLIKGYTLRDQANLMSSQGKAANLSGLIQSLGDIGYENFNINNINWLAASGALSPGAASLYGGVQMPVVDDSDKSKKKKGTDTL